VRGFSEAFDELVMELALKLGPGEGWHGEGWHGEGWHGEEWHGGRQCFSQNIKYPEKKMTKIKALFPKRTGSAL
jgi:hypothetical protein